MRVLGMGSFMSCSQFIVPLETARLQGFQGLLSGYLGIKTRVINGEFAYVRQATNPRDAGNQD